MTSESLLDCLIVGGGPAGLMAGDQINVAAGQAAIAATAIHNRLLSSQA